jgi:hypothetical protein
VERALEPLDIPRTCGVPSGTCGVDVAVVRRRTKQGDQSGGFEVVVMELNARTTMSHYAMAAKRRLPRAERFEIIRLSELKALQETEIAQAEAEAETEGAGAGAAGSGAAAEIVCLTDPETASMFCAVVFCTKAGQQQQQQQINPQQQPGQTQLLR